MSDGSDVAPVRIRADGITRVVSMAGDAPRTVAFEPDHGAAVAVDSMELAVILDVATWRHDVPVWRHRVATPGTDDSTWHLPTEVDAAWRVVPHLHPILTARAEGPYWFRAHAAVRGESRDELVELVLGGLDDQDWGRYEVWIDGRPVADRRASGRIREPHRMVLQPTDPAHTALRRPEGALLAVRCSELGREVPGRVSGELEHHFFQDWLIDQYLAVGGSTLLVDDFRTTSWHAGPGQASLDVEVASASLPRLRATIRYTAEESVVRKRVTLANAGTEQIRVLDVVSDSWQGAFQPRHGGRGRPVVVGDLFAGIEHPAGVSRADDGQVRLVQMPGIDVAPGATWDAQPVVAGGADAEGVEPAFRRYIEGLRPRPERRVTVYSALGWYDFTNPADPLPGLTAELVDENLDQLAELEAGGTRFDVYMFDDWWERTDLRSFRRSAFPDGPGPSVERIEAMGMRAGLWWATTRAVWSSDLAPGLEGSWANDPSHGAALDLAGGSWRWVEEFTNMFVGERRLCLASEPYRSMYVDAIPKHIGAIRAAILKMDCVVLNCTFSDHGHRPGRHSLEPMVDSLVELLERCRRASPDLRALWYWGFRSPWYLRFGDVTFDKGLLMEAATVASSVAPTTRQSLTLNVDQAIRHARFLPLRLQDSLGVWIGDVAWCNRIGTEGWPEALLVDAARGADLVQLWADLTLLDTDDRQMLGAIMPWLERQLDAGARTTELGGDPWAGEAYGYARPVDGGLAVTLVNPGWTHRSVVLDRSIHGWPSGPWSTVEVYPFPGLVADGLGLELDLALAPWETRVV